MKVIVTIARVLTGSLFVFSGLVKAIDPLGLAYKMQEFFEAWATGGFLPGLMHSLDQYALGFSIIMITLEVGIGVALLLGWQKKLTAWLLLLLVLFFTFLTAYVLFSGKIRACGCFGDCIPLTPAQTFTKDIILLLLVILILVKINYVRPVAKPWINGFYVLLSVGATLLLQGWVLKHLPVKDCLPFKKGNDILQLRKMPVDAIPDKFDYIFVYEKEGIQKEFTAAALPDSSWTFKDRIQQLIQKGKNNTPLINDFTLAAEDGADSTEAILGNPDHYYLFFIKEVPLNVQRWMEDYKAFYSRAAAANRRVLLVTAQRNDVSALLEKHAAPIDAVFTCDATAIKTAARTNPAVFLMKGPVVEGKWSWADLDEIE